MTFKRLGRRAIVLAAAAATIAGVVLPAQAATAPAGDGRFHVSGTKIIGPDGKQFLPRGVNMGGFERYANPVDITYDRFALAKSWGANFIRLPLSSTFWLQGMCSFNQNYAARVDQAVAWAESLHMLILLDDHRSTRGTTCPNTMQDGNNPMADVYSLGLVRDLANRYKDHPYVAFDMYNEPHGISDAIWRSGGNVNGWKAIGMQDLVNTVRGQGATNLVFVSGNQWANDLRMVVNSPLQGSDIVYATHSYPFQCDGKTQPDNVPYSCRGKNYPSFLDPYIGPAANVRAVVATEFGTKRSFASDMQGPINWFEAHHVGWAAYSLHDGTCSNYSLLQQGSADPSITGVPVKNGLAVALG